MELPRQYKQLFFSDRVPLLQNKVYSNPETARRERSGCLNIVQDCETGFAFNADFQQNLVEYDKDYDNSVPSKVFMDYYDQIADYLVQNYDLKHGTVMDVGCGKGTFLTRLANRYDFIQGIGIDPSYEGPSTELHGRLQFIQETFSQKHIAKGTNPAIMLCRHVLEHIPSPIQFLQNIFKPLLNSAKDIPFFIEVPDLSWIVENHAFWDFCYEHVNYFTHSSLGHCITQAGGTVSKISSAFGKQYIWAEGILKRLPSTTSLQSNKQNRLEFHFPGRNEYDFGIHLSHVVEKLRELSFHKEIVIWGMATKGVMYSLYMINNNIDISYCVDINERKQGKYSPISGRKILSPHELRSGKDFAIICMNPNYATEIESQCHELGLKGMLFTPECEVIHTIKN
jgi:SAM-dependent methyltransferase